MFNQIVIIFVIGEIDMRKLLLGTAAVALGMSFAVSEAQAQVKLDLGGFTKMYGVWLDQDETGDDIDTAAPNDESVEVRSLDIARDTEIHFTGETTLDNGLTVGFHTEAHTDGSNAAGGGDSFNVEESYAYFSGHWGRVNLGAEDGATYLLQVAAPSADTNVDGLRQFINPISHANLTDRGSFAGGATNADNVTLADIFGGGGTSISGRVGVDGIILDNGSVGGDANDIRMGDNGAAALGAFARRLDYDHANSGFENKFTYMTPVFNGFQGGFSYTPELGSLVGTGVVANGNNTSSVQDSNDYGEVWEVAARWEGMFDEVGVALGGGWSHTELENERTVASPVVCDNAVFYTDLDANGNCSANEVTAELDDREAWNVGVDFDWKAFGLGGGYTEDDNGVSGDGLETETWFVGLDYTTGPFKLGATYLNEDQNIGGAEMEQDRWTGGVVYTYGPGMTFRGSISFTDFEENVGTRTATTSASGSADATSVLLGTQINF